MGGLWGILKCIINYALYVAHYHACLHKHDDASCVDILVSQIILYSLIIHLNCFHMKYYKKYALLWIH